MAGGETSSSKWQGAKRPSSKCQGRNVQVQNVRGPNALSKMSGGESPGSKCQGAKRPGRQDQDQDNLDFSS